MQTTKLAFAMLFMMGVALPSQAGWLDKAREKLDGAREQSDTVERKSTAAQEFTNDGSVVDDGLKKVDEKNEEAREHMDKADRKLNALEELFGS